MNYHETTLRQFLLSRLEDSERLRLEENLLEDDSLFELSEALDGELIQDLAAGKLNQEATQDLEYRLASTPRGRSDWAYHCQLSAKIRSARRPESSGGAESSLDEQRPRWHQRFLRSRGASALIAALLTVACAWPIFESMQRAGGEENRLLSSQLEELRKAEDRERGAPAPIKVTYALEPLQRSAEAAPQIRLGPGTEIVELWLISPYPDGRFRVRFKVRNEEIAASENLLARSEPWGAVVAVEAPVEWLSSGTLELILDRREEGSAEESWSAIGSYSVDSSKEEALSPVAK